LSVCSVRFVSFAEADANDLALSGQLICLSDALLATEVVFWLLLFTGDCFGGCSILHFLEVMSG
jgi:hypothetical protein